MKIPSRLREWRRFAPGFASKVREAKVRRYERHLRREKSEAIRSSLQSGYANQLLIVQLLFHSVASRSKTNPDTFLVQPGRATPEQEAANNCLFEWMCDYGLIDPGIVEDLLRRQIRHSILHSTYGVGTRRAMLAHWTNTLECVHKVVKASGVDDRTIDRKKLERGKCHGSVVKVHRYSTTRAA